jgi:hypothetical protein
VESDACEELDGGDCAETSVAAAVEAKVFENVLLFMAPTREALNLNITPPSHRGLAAVRFFVY